MPWKPAVVTSSAALSAGGVLLRAIELAPDGGDVEIRIYKGTDTSGTEVYRLRAQEKSEYREFKEGLQLDGPLYLYFQEGSGALIAMY